MTTSAIQKMVRMECMAKFPYLIEITYYNENNVEVLERYANCEEKIVYNSKEYEPMFFSIKPPNRTETGITDGNLTISTVDQTWIVKIRNTQKRAKCKFIACIEYNNDNSIDVIEPIEEMTFTLIKANWNETTMSFTMLFDDRMNINVPMDKATAMKTPALV